MILTTSLLLLAVASTSAPQLPSALKRELIALEPQSWAAWQNHDVPFWTRFLSDDHVEIDAVRGTSTKADVIKGIGTAACKVASFKIDHFSFHQLDPKTVLLVYRAEQDTRCGGYVVPTPVWATSLYQRRAGRWVNVVYGHTPAIVPKPKATP